MSDTLCHVRRAEAGDAEAVADLAAGLATFRFSRDRFGLSYPALLTDGDACLLLAVDGEERLGYLLGFRHLTFYANGPVAWVEEVFVRGQNRGRGIGRALMSAFERWAAARDCGLIALATRRAAPFYRALGFEESAVYFRRSWTTRRGNSPFAAAGRIPPSGIFATLSPHITLETKCSIRRWVTSCPRLGRCSFVTVVLALGVGTRDHG